MGAQPDNGTYVHGMCMEGARWDKAANAIAESRPKELHPMMPVIHILGVTQDKVVKTGVYECPVYSTSIRGPTMVFAAPLRTAVDHRKWTSPPCACSSSP